MDQIIAVWRFTKGSQTGAKGVFNFFQNRRNITVNQRCIAPITPYWGWTKDRLSVLGQPLKMCGLHPTDRVFMTACGDGAKHFEAIRQHATFVRGMTVNKMKQYHKAWVDHCISFSRLDRTPITTKVIIGRLDHRVKAQRLKPSKFAFDGAK